MNHLRLKYDRQKRYHYAKRLQDRFASQEIEKLIDITLPIEIKCLDKTDGVYSFKAQDLDITDYGIIRVRVE